ncbi:CHAT domain-containing protein [Anabaena cylindrica FACHB-243]|uniref:Heterocyst differentiation protein HetF n=1 Tax=Anabaena cylindrica (strain ATCC 27899 / PCC 7122) TaxID=272123 RepID=K9ZKZ9_ANACC|nr:MULTISPECIES: cell division protein HetF [Anabaena]AFZ59871.1 heterocyst differentiation protein HetF [Anabaena cylindrica PCC 7122]MBD2416700.1 CHAT domain-containing protein [Anabaena cylindrica FACHB-243]MBY5285485.1 CHAT domain-containing protein [Anabaena sp. CCAP 1446/1C]MBY5310363.1 CHAT domain-containing protein [Anabaena sp. CCAP 1446/1C]MCM2409879.1 CHAT domain-containing protein [Anabaena sp. CCAP 1446/1C]
MTQEFHISVTPVGQNDYLVRTEQVAPGVPLAEELVTWPVAEWLAAAGHLMNDPLQLVLQGDAASQSAAGIARNSVNLVALGQQLYNALFQGTLRDSWITAQGIAQNQQQVLRLRLGLKDNKLARLPWEVMHAGDRPLATGPYIAFSRYQSGIPATSRLATRNIPTPQEDSGVKVLMVISSPTDQVRLDLLKQEAINLQAELHRQNPRTTENGNYFPEIELTLLDQPGREELTQALEQGRYHVLHYSGHSNLGTNGGEIYLVSRRTGLTEILSGDDLAGLLVNNNIQMAVFNSCLGAYRAKADTSGETGERNLTESLVKRGLRSVLAMSERIPDEVALTLTQLFYRNLSQGYPLDLCVSRVRQGLISAYGSHQMYWALPMLYLQREFEGFLSPQIGLSANAELFNEYHSPVGTSVNSMYAATDDAQMALNFEDMMPSGLARDASELDWLGDDTWGDLLDEIEYDQPGYDEDSAIVSDLFRQLGNPQVSTEETSMKAELEQPVRENDHQEKQPSQVEEDLDLWGDSVAETASTTPIVEANQANFQQSPLPSIHPPGRRRRLWPIFGLVGAGLAILMGAMWWQHRPSVVGKIPPIPTDNFANRKLEPINLQTSNTGIVTATATEQLSQGNLKAGLEAVDELLNRGALKSAETALALIPTKQTEDPSVNFLRGRLAWQFAQTRDNKYSFDDARRYWEIAVRDQPDSVLYNNALGFAYYAEGNLNRANDAWFKALNLSLNPQNATLTEAESPNPIMPPAALTSYAGLALGLYKSVNNQPVARQAQYLKEAIKLRQTVIENEPAKFTVEKLAQNWLWTEKAIADWRSLLQEQSQ